MYAKTHYSTAPFKLQLKWFQESFKKQS